MGYRMWTLPRALGLNSALVRQQDHRGQEAGDASPKSEAAAQHCSQNGPCELTAKTSCTRKTWILEIRAAIRVILRNPMSVRPTAVY